MNKTEQNAKKARHNPVYSNTYGNGGWSERDSLPTSDPIGDVPESFIKDSKKLYESIKDRLLVPKGKFADHYTLNSQKTCGKTDRCCNKSENHKKVHLVYSAYRMCKVCGSDLGDWN